MTRTSELLVDHPFLAGLSDDRMERLASWGTRMWFRTGSRVFSEGGKADRFWLIREGEVALDIHVPGRGDLLIELLGPGTVLGWSWLYPPYQWRYGATAVAQTLTIAFDAAAVRRASAEDPELGYELYRRFIAVVVDRLQATRQRLLEPDGGAVGLDEAVRSPGGWS